MSRAKEMAQLAGKISALVHETQKERGMTAGYLGSEGANFSTELIEQRKLVDEKHKGLMLFMADTRGSGYSADFLKAIQSGMARLDKLDAIRSRVTSLSIPTGEALGYYTGFNASMLDSISSISQETEYGPIKRQFFAFALFLKGKERAGIERAVLSNTFAKDSFAPGFYRRFVELVDQQKTYLHEFLVFAEPDQIVDYEAMSSDEVFAQVQAYREIAMAKADAGGFAQDAGAWFATSTKRINAFKSFEDALATQLIASAETEYGQASLKRMMIFPIVAVSLLIPVFTFWVIRSILRPLKSMMSVLEKAETDADLTARVESNRKDEIGDLASKFNAFVDRVQGLIVEVRQATQSVASASTEIAASSSEIADSMSQTENHIHAFSAMVSDVATSVEEVVVKCEEATRSADQSGDIAKQGGSVVEQTVQGMQAIHNSVSDSADTVQDLGKRSEQIGAVITVINDIADQTNLLALNAAIEAARAGQHGRGFAVVADEVRKLADRTTKATHEIVQSISTIQSETTQAVEQIKSGTQQVEAGVEHATEAGQSLGKIVESTRQVSEMIQSIHSAATHQASVSTRLDSNIREITTVTEQAATGTNQAMQAANDLSSQAQDLFNMLDQFKTKPNPG
ncbi:MAG: methyl-accepting chemotaxis protein [Planctomycetota bacterium]